jgi:Zn-dependent peptidase ImmA (M78 family)
MLHYLGSLARLNRILPLAAVRTAKILCRLRFDLGHEAGHLIMHRGVQTSDNETEEQANRFASAFLLPKSSFVHEYPRSRFDRTSIFELKLRWKASAAAILRRAYDLRMISADQYRTGHTHLSKTGQKKLERYDDVIESDAVKAVMRDNLDVPLAHSVSRKLPLMPRRRGATASGECRECSQPTAGDALTPPLKRASRHDS